MSKKKISKPKSRTADYTIAGFLYQLNLTLLELLDSAQDSMITVEGLIEDIDILDKEITTAVQCKYHEATKYTPSVLYKPLLQMMEHFHKNNEKQIRYKLLAHFPDKEGSITITATELQAVLNSTDTTLAKYTAPLKNKVDIAKFLTKFEGKFSPSLESITNKVHASLLRNGILQDDLETIAYPNAINFIAMLSINHLESQRKTSKKKLLEFLARTKSTAISRWTLALKTREALLKAKREQLRNNLSKNIRLRYLVIFSECLPDFEEQIVLFISDFQQKYNHKISHTEIPVVCISTTRESYNDIQVRLYSKGINTNDGYRGGQFIEDLLFRQPITKKLSGSEFQREFDLRFLFLKDHSRLLNRKKADDVFIIGDGDCSWLETKDVNIERLGTTSFSEIKYMMGIANVIE